MVDDRAYASVAAMDGKLWVTGGYSHSSRQIITSMEAFDPATNTWDTTKAPMINPRKRHALAVLNGELHAVGGIQDSGLVGKLVRTAEKYDPRANSWSVVPGMALPPGTGQESAPAVLLT